MDVPFVSQVKGTCLDKRDELDALGKLSSQQRKS